MKKQMTFSEEQAAVKAAAATFPAQFTLRAFPGVQLYVNVPASFYSDYAGGVQLVMTRVDGQGDFGRDTPEAIRAQMVVETEPTFSVHLLRSVLATPAGKARDEYIRTLMLQPVCPEDEGSDS